MSSVKEWLDTHPAALVLGIAVSVGSTASGITAYLITQINKAHEIEIANKYNSQISDLTTRLSSIERRAGSGPEKKYLDVQSLQIALSEVKILPAQFKNYDKGSFFLNLPVSDAWNYSILTEGEIGKLGPLKSLVEQAYKVEGLQKVFDRNKAHVWYLNPIAEVRFKAAD